MHLMQFVTQHAVMIRTILIWYGLAAITAVIGLYKRDKLIRLAKSNTTKKVAEFIRPRHISSTRKTFVMMRKTIVIGVIWWICSLAEQHHIFERAGKSGELIIGSFVDHWIFPESEMADEG